MHTRSTGKGEGRWGARPGSALVVKAAILILPLAVGLAAAIAVSWIVPRPAHGPLVALWWLGALGASALAVALVLRPVERLLPLVTLLRLSLAFPDRTPSRMGLALRAGSVRRLEAEVAELRAHGRELEAGRAAELVLVLAAALNTHDRRTRGHCERVRALSEVIAEELELSPEDRNHLRWASLLHDCGKVMVDADILNKSGKLTAEEWEVMRRHPEEGARIAAPLRGWLGQWSDAIEQHHERWDGGGYPKGLGGEDISLAARIVAVADSFDAMTSVRSYNTPMSAAAARAEITTLAGAQFDPSVVRAFLMASTGRLLRVVGPLSWLSWLPLLGTGVASAAELPARHARAALSAVGGGTALTAAAVLGVIGPVVPTPPPAAHVASAPLAPPVVRLAPAGATAPQPPPPAPAQPPAPAPPVARPAAVAVAARAPMAPRLAAPAGGSPRPVAPTTPAPPSTPPPASPPPPPAPSTPPPGPATPPPPLVHIEVQVAPAHLSAAVAAVPGACARVATADPPASC